MKHIDDISVSYGKVHYAAINWYTVDLSYNYRFHFRLNANGSLITIDDHGYKPILKYFQNKNELYIEDGEVYHGNNRTYVVNYDDFLSALAKYDVCFPIETYNDLC